MNYGYDNWFVSPLQGDEKVSPMPPIEDDEELKKGKKTN